MDSWAGMRSHWIMHVNNVALLSVIASVVTDHRDDTSTLEADHRFENILWLATRGRRGKEWGHAGPAVLAHLSSRTNK